ncbi:photosynthetic reaction center cytochrome c subunit [Bdellovibrio sp. SKB1291214]|uniref:photosynthetic reaction center cytochrome c subunit n=1 Tax=Bdellovibrio sp. SKB1291214 TaxID=1732569 RepID=UPI000B515FD1|nr:photosynthetic reaction center cytochrome c subunit [Bdellovibrio sp. SKB1291214]UYL09682.1 photosynthetic reaction center cytochrome c subunit [Bdellovibrio sp. SKB1291214]
MNVHLGLDTVNKTGSFLISGRVLRHASFMQRTHLVFILFTTIFFMGSLSVAESVPKFVKNEEKIREEMVTISRELGVTCTECHNVQNFTDDSKKSFKVGKEHMKLTQMLKENGFDGKKGPAATCYMCHRGKLMPDFKEPASAKAH